MSSKLKDVPMKGEITRLAIENAAIELFGMAALKRG